MLPQKLCVARRCFLRTVSASRSRYQPSSFAKLGNELSAEVTGRSSFLATITLGQNITSIEQCTDNEISNRRTHSRKKLNRRPKCRCTQGSKMDYSAASAFEVGKQSTQYQNPTRIATEVGERTIWNAGSSFALTIFFPPMATFGRAECAEIV